MTFVDSQTGGNPFPSIGQLPDYLALYYARLEDTAVQRSNVPYVQALSAQRRDSLLSQIGVNLNNLYNPNLANVFPSPTLNADFQIPQFNNQLTFPNLLFPTSFLGASANTSGVVPLSNGELGTPTNIQDLPDAPGTSKCNPFTGQDCTISPLGQSLDNFLTANVTPTIKKIGLLILALILFAFGLYFLATSTKTGKAALNIATKV